MLISPAPFKRTSSNAASTRAVSARSALRCSTAGATIGAAAGVASMTTDSTACGGSRRLPRLGDGGLFAKLLWSGERLVDRGFVDDVGRRTNVDIGGFGQRADLDRPQLLEISRVLDHVSDFDDVRALDDGRFRRWRRGACGAGGAGGSMDTVGAIGADTTGAAGTAARGGAATATTGASNPSS